MPKDQPPPPPEYRIETSGEGNWKDKRKLSYTKDNDQKYRILCC